MNNVQRKLNYKEKLRALDDKALRTECEQYIWLSAYASNNPKSDYHWKCDYCYDICKEKGKIEIYNEAHKEVSKC